MEYKVCIVGAGKGTRMNFFTNHLNKALLPVHGKPVISHIIESFPKEVEIVFAIGYKGEELETFVKFAYPDRNFTFVTVDNIDGPGSGPGYSLLCCKEHLQCPFIFDTVDTMTQGTIPEPDHNWFGVNEVEDTSRFCSVASDENGIITRIDDKVKTDNKYAFIGIAGINDYEAFWNALENNKELKGGEKQVSNGFEALMEKGMKIVELDWYDTGVPATYENTINNYPKD